MTLNPFAYLSDLRGQIAAIEGSQAVIEFAVDGTIRRANGIFLDALGYRLDEIRGQHHRMFMDPAEAKSEAYARFWEDLAKGEFKQGEFRRIAKGGREIWIQATYTPMRDRSGRPTKVIKFATEVTLRHQIMEKAVEATRMILNGSRLGNLADALTRNATQTARQSEDSERSSAEVENSVGAVARGSEQMLAAIQEISRSSAQAAGVARDAVRAAEAANERVQRLGESSRTIGTVVEMIHGIAQQTNLLALNATIEASRAGEAGRGFAVVADEVKQLARRTEEATRQIGAQIGSIQTDTHQAVQGIGEISRVISQVDSLASTIAAAVEEQTVTTNEITANVQVAADGSARISQSLAVVAQAARETSESAEETRSLASTIAGDAGELNDLIRRSG